MLEKDLFWLVGILEGEGCFGLGPPKNPNRMSIVVSMTDKDVMQRVSVLLNCPLLEMPGKKPGYKTQWRLHMTGAKKCFPILDLIYPHMGERRKKRIDDIRMSYNPNLKKKKKVHLTEENVARIYIEACMSFPLQKIALSFHTSKTTVYHIKTGKQRAGVTQNKLYIEEIRDKFYSTY